MILILLRYIKGCLSVRFDGVYSEKVLNLLASENISVWRLRYANGSISARMFAKDFKKLRKLRKNTDVKVRIIQKYGFPFFWKKYSCRTGFLSGVIIFFVLLKFLSTFIWVINVEGNHTVKTSEIVKTLNSIGISENIKSSKIDAKRSAQRLLIKRNDLAWASLNIEGCVLNVNVTEIEKKPETDHSVPTNLIAGCDGIIKKIEAVSGDVKVKVGQNVHRGDLLVSGIIENMLTVSFVESNAVVVAQVEKSYHKKELFAQSIKQKTGKSSNNDVLEILGAKIPLFLPKNEKNAIADYDIYCLSFLGKKIPVTLYKKRLSYFYKINTFTSEETIKNQLSSKLKAFLESKDIQGYIPIGTEYYTDDEGVTISHRYLCDIDIADECEILLSQ